MIAYGSVPGRALSAAHSAAQDAAGLIACALARLRPLAGQCDSEIAEVLADANVALEAARLRALLARQKIVDAGVA